MTTKPNPRSSGEDGKIPPHVARMLRVSQMHENVAASVPQLRRGKVWCVKCGRELDVNAADCLRNGWPKCHGQTMTIDSPEERRPQ
jgi:Zn finger protein HypA/HybF involved in hydrogenase expression